MADIGTLLLCLVVMILSVCIEHGGRHERIV